MVKRFINNIWKFTLTSVLSMMMFCSSFFAQKVSGNFIVDESSDSLFVGRIQVNLDEGSSAIGNAVIRYKYNPNRLEFPEEPEEGKDFTIHNFQNGEYIASISHPSEDVISINIAKLFGNDISIFNDPIDVAEVRFLVKNSESSNEFQTDVIQFFSPLSSEMWDLGDWVVTEGNNSFEFVTLISPINNDHNISNLVTFEWKEIASAQNYHLQISKKDDFSNTVYNDSELTQNKIQLELENDTKYFWRVAYSNGSEQSSFSSSFNFTTRQEILQVISRSPVNDSTIIGNSIWFKWESVSGRDYYQFQAATDQEFSNVVKFLDSLEINEIEVNNFISGQEYFWRARASIGGEFGKYSEINRFFIEYSDTARPNLIAPVNYAIDVELPVTFHWEIIDTAISYQLEVAEDHNFDDIVYINEYVETNSQTVYYLENGKKYYWRVRFSNYLGNSMYSNVFSFETLVGSPTVPTLIAPLNNAVDLNTEIFFKWKNEGIADYYRIDIYKDSGLQNLFYTNDSVKSNEIMLGGFEEGSNYYWRVKSINMNGKSGFSDLFKFRTRLGMPSILSLVEPLNNAIGLDKNIKFVWNRIDSAVFYKIEISKDSDFNNISYFRDSILTTELTILNFEEGSQFYWRVLSYNEEGSITTSNIFNFSTHGGIPELPVAVYPANNEPNVDIEASFIWAEVEDAECYHLEVSTDIEFKNLIFSQDTISTNECSVNKIGEGREYFWRVKAQNQHGTSIFTEASKFTVKVNKPTDLGAKIAEEKYVRLSWKDNSKVENIFILERKRKVDFEDTKFIVLDTLAANLTYYFDRSIENDETYIYRIRSENSIASSDYSNPSELKFSTKLYDPSIPEEYALSQNYPNPFNPSTKINYSLKAMSEIGIKIYNIIGEEVATLINEVQDPGTYTLEWDASHLASGVYLYVMTTTSFETKEKFHAVKKMMLVK